MNALKHRLTGSSVVSTDTVNLLVARYPQAGQHACHSEGHVRPIAHQSPCRPHSFPYLGINMPLTRIGKLYLEKKSQFLTSDLYSKPNNSVNFLSELNFRAGKIFPSSGLRMDETESAIFDILTESVVAT